MKLAIKFIGLALAFSFLILLACAYIVSCINTGRALSWEQFSEGLTVRGSNCGGNSAAASVCRYSALIAVVARDSGDILDFSHLSEEYQEQLKYASTNMWTPEAKYLFRSGSIHTGHDTHDIVVVCDTAYGNVPQPSIWNLHHRTIRHAVGYSDGSIGWLTPAEFAALNKTNFFEMNFSAKTIQSGTNVFE